MKNLKAGIPLAAAIFGVATSALGGVAGSMSVTVTPIQANATYSSAVTGLNSVVGYQVDIQNVGSNTNNSVRFTAQTYVTDAAEMSTYAYDSAEGAVCSVTTGPTAVALDCPIGTLSSGQSYPTFYVFFKTPVFVGNGIGDSGGTSPTPNDTDFVNFNYQVFYAEGGNGPKSTPKNGFTTLTAATPLLLGTPDPTKVKSVVLKTGGTFFTGNQGIAAVGDLHATKTAVPALTSHTTAEIVETGTGNSTTPCTGNVITCYTSQITIPGTFDMSPYLTIRLSQRIENIRVVRTCGWVWVYEAWEGHYEWDWRCSSKPVPIEQILIQYLPDGAVTPLPVDLCTPVGSAPPTDRPCITARTVVLNAPSTGTPIRYEWELVTRHNGGYKVL